MAGWFGAVVLAVLVGLAAINVIGAGLTSSGGALKSSAEVERELAALPSPASTPASPSASRSAAAQRSFNTRGGIVVATCAAITSMSPLPGFVEHERNGLEGEFRSTSDNHDRVKFSITCPAGRPTLTPRGGGGDD
jgi:hypothetical protein